MIETRQQLLQRIVIIPGVCGGKPIIRGHRMTVGMVIGMLADGASQEDLLKDYEWLEKDDILACLLFASRMLEMKRYINIPVADPIAS